VFQLGTYRKNDDYNYWFRVLGNRMLKKVSGRKWEK
jgi:hypothetical protein